MLLDSYSWIEFFKGSEKGKKVEEFLEELECFTCIVSISEITAWALKNGFEPNPFISKIKGLSQIMNLNEEIVKNAGKINFEKKKEMRDFGMIDSVIYSTALYYGLKVLTGDEHFEGLDNVEML